jgi:hypothetical protein
MMMVACQCSEDIDIKPDASGMPRSLMLRAETAASTLLPRTPPAGRHFPDAAELDDGLDATFPMPPSRRTEFDATELDATELDATELDATFPDATELDATFPDATELDATFADAAAPDATDPDASAPDVGPSDGGPSIDFAALSWSIQAIVDPRTSVFGVPQTNGPRNLRGLAISPSGRYLYAGYLNTSSISAELRQIDLTLSGTAAIVNRAFGLGGKSIAVDDLGRVYVAGQERITVHTSSLTGPIFEIPGLIRCEGLTVTREAGELVVYSTDRTLGTLERRVLSESGGAITGAVLSGLGGLGQLSIDPNGSLRNVKVDPSGRIWVVAYAGNRVYRLDPDGGGLVSTHVEQPFDLGFDGPYVLVTHDLARDITRLDANTLAAVPPGAAPPWTTSAWSSTDRLSALTGLVVLRTSASSSPMRAAPPSRCLIQSMEHGDARRSDLWCRP